MSEPSPDATPEVPKKGGPEPYISDPTFPVPVAHALNWRGCGRWPIESKMVRGKEAHPEKVGRQREMLQRHHQGANMVWPPEHAEAFLHAAARELRRLGLGAQGICYALREMADRHCEQYVARDVDVEDVANDAVTWSVDAGCSYTHGVMASAKAGEMLRDALEARGVSLALNERAMCPMLSNDDGENWMRAGDEELAWMRDEVTNNTVVLPDLAWVETWDEDMMCPVPESGRLEWMDKPVPLGKAMSTRQNWETAVLAHFALNKIDPFMEWLENLAPWDGEARLDGWLETLFDVDKRMGTDLEAEYIRYCSRFLLMAAVKRTYEPGAQIDETLVLCGPQGCGKSSYPRWLVPEDQYFTDDIHFGGPGDYEARLREALQGRVIVEFSEMGGVIHEGMLNRVKGFLSRRSDNYRKPYARTSDDNPRRCVFCATTNDAASLPADPTGNRRFLAVDVRLKRLPGLDDADNYDALREMADEAREQLWAEARHRVVELGESVSVPTELAAVRNRQAIRHVNLPDVFEDLPMVLRGMWDMARSCDQEQKPYPGLTGKQILEAMGYEAENDGGLRGHSTKLGRALKLLGLVRTDNHPRTYVFGEDFDPSVLPSRSLHPPQGGYAPAKSPGLRLVDGGKMPPSVEDPLDGEDPPY